MNILLKNEELTICLSDKGAELQSIIANKTGINYMWDGDKNYWGKFSPILFPIVGALKDNSYTYQGNSYTLSRHGFARDMVFSCKQLSDVEVEFTLTDNETTQLVYPFQFKLSVIYCLDKTSLQCKYKVENLGAKDLLFSIGGHPAFAAPLNAQGTYTDYYLAFDKDDEITYHHIDGNLISEKTTTLPLVNKQLPLKHDLFYADALVFKSLKSTTIMLKNRLNNQGISFEFEGFPFFGIWAAIDANFVCLEPWCGIADGVNHTGDLENKEGIMVLPTNEIWERSWSVNVL